MSRTYRRRGERHEYDWVLRDWKSGESFDAWTRLDRHSKAGRQALARFHSDAEVTMGSSAPRWYRRRFDHKLRSLNDRQLRRWLADPDYDPVFQVRHLHVANWSWW